MKTWVIYCHTHIESGRRYIGLTSQTWQKRWKTHVSHAKNSKGGRWHFPNAIRKYGPGAFESIVIETCDSLELANEREKYWISHFDTRNPEKGFNLASGGGSQPHPIRKNPWNNPEYRAKASQAAKVRWLNPVIRQANIAAVKASLNTPESRAKRSLTSKAALARPEVRAKIEANDYRRDFTPEFRAKLSAANKARSPELIAQISKSLRGKKHSPEHIEKLRKASAGRIKSPEEIAKMSAAVIGRKHSSEHLTKIATRRRIRDAVRIASRTHFDCKKHGSIPLVDCYKKKVRDIIRYECRACRKAFRTQDEVKCL